MYREAVNRDHLWAGREMINSREANRRKQQAYQEELLRQIAQKNSLKNQNDNQLMAYAPPNMSRNDPLNQTIVRRSYDSSTGPSASPNQGENSPSQQPYLKSGFGQSVGAFGVVGPKNLQFTQALKTQIETATRPGASTEITIPPLSTIPQPIPMSFAAAARFDEAKFEFLPSATNNWKSSSGTYSRITPVSMLGVSNVRSSIKSSLDPNIQVNVQPLRVSKVDTPPTGFSMRNSAPAPTWNPNDYKGLGV